MATTSPTHRPVLLRAVSATCTAGSSNMTFVSTAPAMAPTVYAKT